MDRCALANHFHKQGFNCAQSVLAAFGDLTNLPARDALAVAGGMGGGIGGSHEEVCGAISGAVMALGLLYPHVRENDPESKRRAYGIAREFQRRFSTRFHASRCADLLAAPCTPCPELICGAVEIVEELLEEASEEK